MTDWIKHNGGPQPVADDVLVTTWSPDDGGWRIPASAVDWSSRGFQWRVINQHLIDAARIEGIRLGLEAAAQVADHDWPDPNSPIRRLEPDTIAREAVLDQLTREAQADNMGYDNGPR